MKRPLSAALFMAFVGSAITAPAALIERDWKTTGDGLLTYDSRTGLEWLDITQTKLDDFTAGSLQEDRFQAVLAETLPGGRFEGFSVASVAQAMELAASAGAEFENGLYEVNGTPTKTLLSLIGVSITAYNADRLTGILSDIDEVTRRRTFGIYRDFESVPARRAFTFIGSYRINSQPYPNLDQPGVGIMLVRAAVPEANSIALLAIAALAPQLIRPGHTQSLAA